MRIEWKKSSFQRLLISLFVLLAAGVLALVIYRGSTKPSERKATAPATGWVVKPEDWIMTPDEAVRFVSETVHTEVQKALNDVACPPGVKNRIGNLFQSFKDKRVGYWSLPFYFPGSKTMLLRTEPDKETGQLRVVVFVPLARDLYQKYLSAGQQETFEWEMAIAYAHEQAHVEFRSQHPGLNWEQKEVRAQDEAQTWGITLLEMVRPLLAAGKPVASNYVSFSEEFSKVGDDYAHPAWVRAFLTQAVQ